jgi:hypothetical protein
MSDTLRDLCRQQGWQFSAGTGKRAPTIDEAGAWADRRQELAIWTLERLANRVDVHGQYLADGSAITSKEILTPEKLEQHFAATGPGQIVGVHSTLPELIKGPDGSEIVLCTSKLAANDVDWHESGLPPKANERAATVWYKLLVSFGFHPLLIETSPGGYRIFVLFAERIQTSIAYVFMHWVQRDWRAQGLLAVLEVFPKKPIIGISEYENWVRLPGPNPRHPGHYTRVWSGTEWLRGHAAIDAIIALTGDDPGLIPPEARRVVFGEGVGGVRERNSEGRAQPTSSQGAAESSHETPPPKDGATVSSDRPKGFNDLALAAAALRFLSPQADKYHDWLNVGFALHELGDPGLALWDSWSATCEAKYQPGVCAAKWQTFDSADEMNGRAGITLGWLFHRAKQAGWQFPKTQWGSGTTAPPDEEELPIPEPEWPDLPKDVVYHGLAGDLVRLLEPTTEADSIALLLQVIVGVGNLVGRGPWTLADGHKLYTNEAVVLVGSTSRSRKGSSWRRVKPSLESIDKTWAMDKIRSGLSSGEGLIHEIRDEVYGQDKKGSWVLKDPGVKDKRLLVVESEFGNVLRVLIREGSTLSRVMREAFDSDDLHVLTKHSPTHAANPHVSMIGHITHQELERYLDQVEIFNGWGNRILWACVRRSKLLPNPIAVNEVEQARLAKALANAVERARTMVEVKWTPAAGRVWESGYDALTKDRPGVLGAMTSRSEAHTKRLAMLYALLDSSSQMREDHYHAALELWRYCERSACMLFGLALGNKTAERILVGLCEKPGGMTQTEIRRELFQGHKSGAEIASALGLLLRIGLVEYSLIQTTARSAKSWTPTALGLAFVARASSVS